MSFPIFLPLMILFIILLAISRNRQTKAQDDVSQAFLERENQANLTRRQDISGLDYLPYQPSQLPLSILSTEEALNCEKIFNSLANQRIINLSDKSNTDLKLLYGPQNLPDLTAYDENYTLLTTTLIRYSRCLKESGNITAAVQVLEYGMQIHSDIPANYAMLSDLYSDLKENDKLQTLQQYLDTLDPAFVNRVHAYTASS